MKKLTMLWFAGLLLLASCAKHEKKAENTDDSTPAADLPVAERRCAAMDVLNEQLKNDPTLAGRMAAIEEVAERVKKDKSLLRLQADGTVLIPVVVNVLYKTTAQNVSDAQIQSQIDVLNADYNGSNSEYAAGIPALFDTVKAGIGVHFVLKSVVRQSTTKTSWSTNDAMKKSSQGGINPTTPDSVLNIWVVGAMSGGVIGYAQFPGGSSATDGVVIAYNCLGNTGAAASPFDLGRTATHEIGHWLNLRHIWGDATCGTDYVDDTPLHNAANYGCPVYPHLSTCTGTPVEMTMNFMDYTDDACMYMFTRGQKARMLATFVSGGGRTLFAQ